MPRAGLNKNRVVDEAEHLADEVGLSRLTLAALAERLGVRQPSLYKHIDSMAGLHRSISLRAKIELADILGRATVGRWRGDAIDSMSKSYRRWALEHPGRYEAAQRAPDPDDEDDVAASTAVVKVCADVLLGYDLRGDDAIDSDPCSSFGLARLRDPRNDRGLRVAGRHRTQFRSARPWGYDSLRRMDGASSRLGGSTVNSPLFRPGVASFPGRR